MLEACDESGRTTVGMAALQRLMRELRDAQPIALHDPHRYALQVRLAGVHPAEALVDAVARWGEAVARLGLPDWPLCRAEVLTLEEFDRDLETASARLAGPGPPPPPEVAPQEGNPADALLRDAFHDSLTGLANQELFRERVRLALGRPAPGAGVTVLLLDLDGFALVNERLGHARGDQVLAMVAARLRSAVGSDGIAARLGGDQFAVLLDDGPSGPDTPTADSALSAVRDPFVVAGQLVTLTASAGLARGRVGVDPDRLLRDAGTAMCAAKEAGGNRMTRFEPTMHADVTRWERPSDPVLDRLGYVILLQRAAVAANTGNDLVGAAHAVLQEVCAHTGWPVGCLYVTSADGQRVEPAGTRVGQGLDRDPAFAKATSPVTQRRGEGVAGTVLATGRAAWRFDLASLVDPDAAAVLGAAAIRSALGFPVLVGDRVAGVLEFYSRWAEPPEGSLVEVLAAVGAQLGRVVERTESHAALRQSEQRYRALAQSASDAIVSVDHAGLIVSWNDAARATFGHPEAEALGQPVGVLAPDHLDGPVEAVVAHLSARADEGCFMELTCRRSDGSPFPAESSISSWEADGRRYFTCILRDVTRRHQVEHDLRASEARFRALIETSADAIIVLGPDGSIREHFEGARFLGYEPGSNSGRSGIEFLHPDDVGVALQALLAMQGLPGLSPAYEFRVRHADGSWRWVEAVGNNLVDHPDIGGIVVTARDITYRRGAQQARLETQQRWAALFDAFAETVAVVGDGGVVLSVTEGAVAPGVAVGRLTHPDDAHVLEGLVDAATRTDRPVGPAEARIGSDGGGWRRAQWTAVNLLHHPRVAGVVMRAREIGARADRPEGADAGNV